MISFIFSLLGKDREGKIGKLAQGGKKITVMKKADMFLSFVCLFYFNVLHASSKVME